jgi:hypothetical protein
MDRWALPGAIIEEVGAGLTAALTAVTTTLLTADLDGVERCLQGVSRPVMGREVEQGIAARVAAPPDPAACAGRARPRPLHGRVGDDTLRRPSSVCAAGQGGDAVSPGLGRVLARAGLEAPVAAAADQVGETLGGWCPRRRGGG